ncbi:hypothetical protein NMG60_11014610 [Bertholletia excelsa]
MYSDFHLFSVMGMNDHQRLFLSIEDPNSIVCNPRSRPALEFQDECQTAPKLQHEEDEEREGEKGERLFFPSIKIKIPTLGEFSSDDDHDGGDGYRTPTSRKRRIPAVPSQCPPAPRKPKARPLTKRKAASRRLFLDLSSEVESMFPPALLADLRAGKIRKLSGME